MNKYVCTGRTTKEIEILGSAEKTYTRFTLAVEHPYKKDSASFVNFVAFGKTAELMGEYVKKGHKILVEGYLVVSVKDDVYYTNINVEKIEFLEKKQGNDSSNNETKKETKKETDKKEVKGEFDSEDEFPF